VPEGSSAAPEAASRSVSTAAALADRVAALDASAVGDDGAIRVTVGGSGLVTGLELDDRVRRLPGSSLSVEILRTIRRAQAALTERVAAAVDDTVGPESETGKAVLDSFSRRFPPEPDEAGSPEPPVMPAPPFPTFRSTPTLPHQLPGNGFESGRDSRAR
jgi:YbaB/EbfC DNA-binding family